MVPQSILWRTPPKGGAYAASVSLLTAFRKENIAEALPEGRSQHRGGVAEKPSEAYPSFSLDGEPPTIRSYSGFSDVNKAFTDASIANQPTMRKRALVGLGAGLIAFNSPHQPLKKEST